MPNITETMLVNYIGPITPFRPSFYTGNIQALRCLPTPNRIAMNLTQVRNATRFIEYAGTTFLIDPMLAENLHYSLGNHEIYIPFE